MRYWVFAALLLLLTFPSAAQATQSGTQEESPRYFVEADVDTAAVYVGQPVVYRIRLYALDVTTYDYLAPSFEAWWRDEAITSLSRAVQMTPQYFVSLRETLIYPIKAGRLTLDGGQIVIPATVFSEAIPLAIPPVTVEVMPLPEGAPESFTGAVGRFSAKADLDALTVRLGEPLTLRFRVNGAGNLAQIMPPHFPDIEGWRVYANPTATHQQSRGIGERVFEWRLMAETVGTQALPPLDFSYFDPSAGAYVTITGEALMVNILPSEDGTRELPSFRRGVTAPVALTLKPVVLGANGAGVPLWLWGIPAVAVIGASCIRRLQTRRRAYLAAVRRQNALKVAKQQLQAARKTGDYALIERAILRYLADRTLASAALLPRSEVPQGALRVCLLQAEEGRYAPEGAVAFDQLVNQTMAALNAAEKTYTASEAA